MKINPLLAYRGRSANSADIGCGFDLITGPSWTERTEIFIEFSLTPLLHQRNFIGTRINPSLTRGDGEDNYTYGLAGGAPPLEFFLLSPTSLNMLILTEGLIPHRLSLSPIFGVSNLSEGLGNGDWRWLRLEMAESWILPAAEIHHMLYNIYPALGP